jgi:TfoX/Sxy family transcriptional regulator of competence genes
MGSHLARPQLPDLLPSNTWPVGSSVAYDERLADRIRALVAGEPGLTEKKMFGGLAFLIGDNMAVAASGQGGMMVRVDLAESERLTGTTSAEVAVMRGRPMPGWLRVASADVATDRELAEWVERGTGYARSLPAKR